MNARPLAAALASTLAFALPALADGRACELVSPEELSRPMGGKPAMKPSVQPNGVEVCTGRAAGTTATLRVFPRSADFEEANEKALDEHEKLQKMGAMYETRKVGKISCVAIGPGGKAARQSYVTTCSVSKGQRHAVIELRNPSLSISMKDVSPIADAIAGRLY